MNHLKNTLKILICGYCSGINQNGISELQCIEELNCCDNEKIGNVNHLKNTLKILECSGSTCGIDQCGISELIYIEKLNCQYNDKIKDIGHLNMISKPFQRKN